MDITTILGLIVGLTAIIGAMYFKHLSPTIFLNPAAFFVIIVGTVATILNSYPLKNLKSIGALFKIIFTNQQSTDIAELIKQMVALANEARKEGLLSLENRASEIEDPFLRKGLRMVIDGMGDEYIMDVLGTEIESMEARHETNAGIFTSAGTYAPTLGVLGAVFGLIAAMANIDNTEAVAEAIAAAFIATILGIFTGYVLWHPFAKKLKVKSAEEVLIKSMIIEGLLSIQKGDSPLMVQEKLLSTLPESQQNEVLESLKQY
ncbi:chemotaxis protein MotA [Kineothrix alysoides]|jgi:chemotaxis protein MotA|uniref:Chemotaxis protein MotA n=1 Tax=Kineothrix alysoides TaxID=1469948 RepID=A0A4R1QT25_9FIRM|nr:flagellar motor stator protein MotA [Kineothrix alysoides]TCL54004.1 chemotaxis protein MotA [Kineothrix alysoides]